MKSDPRVAFFTDSYLEVNGVARTSMQFAAFTQRRECPFLVVHAAPETGKLQEGSLTRLGLKRTIFGFGLDEDLRFDLLMWRHVKLTIETVRDFKAEAIHVTGPSDIGLLGVYVAHKLRLPLLSSWHTNVHEYAGRRLGKAASFLPTKARSAFAAFAERESFRLTLQFYKLAKVLLAPNEEIGATLERGCNRPVFMMRRGVDVELFSPTRRLRRDDVFTIGYVGRLTPEKNVRTLARIEQDLIDAGEEKFRFLIVGAGSEREWLEANMRCAEFAGVLKGEALARAYAGMDAFVFPSETDTFGNVVLEAQASSVPAIVSARGGPKFIIRDGVTGIVANGNGFAEAILRLKSQPERRLRMCEAARRLACDASWESVFEQVFEAYAACLRQVNVVRGGRVEATFTATNAAR